MGFPYQLKGPEDRRTFCILFHRHLSNVSYRRCEAINKEQS